MKTVKVSKEELLIKVKQNLEKHITEYEQTVQGYNEDLRAALKKAYSDAHKEKPVNLNDIVKFCSVPQSHETDYQRTISMLEMSTDNIIELTSQEFNQIVLDEWNWKQQFEMSASTYNKFKV